MELTPQDVKTIGEMRRWMQTNGQAGTVRPAFTRKPPRMIPASKIRLIKAPSGGIPGRVGTLLGSVQCDVWNESEITDQIQDSTLNITVYNWATSAVCKTGSRYGLAGWCNGAWYVIAEDCNDTGSTVQSASISGTVTTPADPLQLDTQPSVRTFVAFQPVTWYGAGVGGGFG